MSEMQEIKNLLLNHINQSRDDKEKLMGMVSDVKDAVTEIKVHNTYFRKEVDDHEERVGKLEKGHWKQTGFIAAILVVVESLKTILFK